MLLAIPSIFLRSDHRYWHLDQSLDNRGKDKDQGNHRRDTPKEIEQTFVKSFPKRFTNHTSYCYDHNRKDQRNDHHHINVSIKVCPRIDKASKIVHKSMLLAHPESRQSRVATPKKPWTIKKNFHPQTSFSILIAIPTKWFSNLA